MFPRTLLELLRPGSPIRWIRISKDNKGGDIVAVERHLYKPDGAH